MAFAVTGLLVASEESIPANQPQAIADVSAEADEAIPTETNDGPAAESEIAPESDELLALRTKLLLPPAPPPSLQTLVDERRDQLRERRAARFDAISGRYAYMSPWMVTYDQTMELYQDARCQLHRRQRDYARLHQDAWTDAMSPWSQSHRKWSRIRSYLTQMEQLDRQEARDAWLAPRSYAFAGPIPW